MTRPAEPDEGRATATPPAGTDSASVAAALIKLAQQEREMAALRRQVADLARQVAAAGGVAPADQDAEAYEPVPSPRWWALDDDGRAEAVERIASWVEHVFRPGYGHLAARLGACWRQHDLCLYLLDWLSELWTVLYTGDERGRGILASQAELQTRILPAAADQLERETADCELHRPERRP